MRHVKHITCSLFYGNDLLSFVFSLWVSLWIGKVEIMWVMVTIEIVDVNFLISLIFIFWTPDEDITFSLLVEIIILMSYGFFWPNLAVYVMRLWSSVFVTVCRTGSNLKQQPAFILPRAALNITRLGSGQSGKYSANTFLKTKEQNVQHSHELFWCDGCHSGSSCLLCVRCMVSCFRHVVPGI